MLATNFGRWSVCDPVSLSQTSKNCHSNQFGLQQNFTVILWEIISLNISFSNCWLNHDFSFYAKSYLNRILKILFANGFDLDITGTLKMNFCAAVFFMNKLLNFITKRQKCWWCLVMLVVSVTNICHSEPEFQKLIVWNAEVLWNKF